MSIEKLMNPSVLEVPAYKPGKNVYEVSEANGGITMHKLSSNENAFGPSPKAIEAIIESLKEGNVYPDAQCNALRQRLAKEFDLTPGHFAVGTGSAALLNATAQVFLTPGQEQECIMFAPSFSLYRSRTLLYGAKPVILPLLEEENYHMDLNRVIDAITENTRIVWLCSPNNPTGNYIPYNDLVAFLKRVPEHVVTFVDEAYIEYADASDCKSVISLVNDYNLIVARTFSKIFGLGAIRVGYAAAKPEIAAYLSANTIIFSVGTGPQMAALAAMDDKDFLDMCYTENRKGRDYLTKELTALGMHVIPSQSNFVFVNTGMDTTLFTAALERKGYIVRGNFTLPRITIGTMEENIGMVEAIREIQLENKRIDL